MDTMLIPLPKHVQLIPLPSSLQRKDITFTDTNQLVVLPDQERNAIDQYWETHHQGWVSSPIATLEEIVHKEGGGLDVRTGVSEYKDHQGADILATNGNLSILDRVQIIGYEVITRTSDGYFLLAYRNQHMLICPQEYDFSGGSAAVMYALENGVEKMRSRSHLPANQRYSAEELLFPFNNPFAHAIPRLSEEHGLKKNNVNEESMKLLGFCRGIYGGRNPAACIYLELTVDSKEYLDAKKEKIDFLERTTGKPQAEKKYEIEQVAFIDEELLPPFLRHDLAQDATGKPLYKNPRSSREYEIADNCIGACLLYLLSQQSTGTALEATTAANATMMQRMQKEWLSAGDTIYFVEKEEGKYRFKLPQELIINK